MPRKGHIARRVINPDGVYKSDLVVKFINSLMYGGEKSAAENIFYTAMKQVEVKAQTDALTVFKKALENIKPVMEVKTRRVGGANYQIPVEVGPDRRVSLGIRWLISFARARSEKGMIDKLAGELLDAFNNKGSAVKKKEDTHRMADANRAFAHYRW
ncbi:MAG: 30S ribosomal protein S7 [Acidobacteria bacterium]|nr:30S ribosomal protein S7 [Acidobacteriota bacterium]